MVVTYLQYCKGTLARRASHAAQGRSISGAALHSCTGDWQPDLAGCLHCYRDATVRT